MRPSLPMASPSHPRLSWTDPSSDAYEKSARQGYWGPLAMPFLAYNQACSHSSRRGNRRKGSRRNSPRRGSHSNLQGFV